MRVTEHEFRGMYRLYIDGELVDSNLQFIEAYCALRQAFNSGHSKATLERQ